MERAHVTRVDQIQVNALADDALVLRNRWADEIRSQFQHGIVVELCGQPLFGQFDPIAGDAGKADFQVVAFGAHRLDLDGFPGRLGRRHDRLGGEVEGNAQDIGVFHVEQVLLVEVVGLAAQGAADDLFAEKLGAEGPHAQEHG